MRKFLVANIWWLTLILSTLLLAAHITSFGGLNIDSTALALLAIILLSPFASAIRRIKIGEFEAEIAPKEVAKIREEVAEIELKSSATPGVEERPPLIYRTLDHIKGLAESEPVLALVQLRIEIERVVNRLARRISQDRRASNRACSLGYQLNNLSKSRILPSEVVDPLRRVISIANRAAHGESIRTEDAAAMIDAGTSLLEQIHWHAYDLAEVEAESTEINQADVREFERAQYELTTITPLIENPRKTVRIVSQDELDDFLDGYNEYAEFIIGLKRIDRPNG